MPRPRKSIPSYRLHKPSGAAYSDYTDPLTGRRRSVCLGPWDSPRSRAEYARLCDEEAAGRPAPAAGLSVAELLLAFLRHAEGHYRRADGSPTDELANYKQALRVVREPRLAAERPAVGGHPRHRLAAGLIARPPVCRQDPASENPL